MYAFTSFLSTFFSQGKKTSGVIAPSFQVVDSASSTATKCPSTILQPSEVANLDLDVKLSLSQLHGNSVVLRLLLITPHGNLTAHHWKNESLEAYLFFSWDGNSPGVIYVSSMGCKNGISRFLQKMPDSRLCDFVLMSLFFYKNWSFPICGGIFGAFP